MDEVIFADFQLLFDDNAAERHLDTVRWVASACLMISTLLLGTFPLSLRTMYSEEWILKTFGKPARPTTRTVITSAMICACAGVLISLVFVCLLPGVTAYPSENQSKSQLGVDTSMGFIMTFVLQELIFLRFGNSDKDYINQYHIYIVQFIRCELNVWKTLPVEPRRPSEELQEQEELAAEIIEMRQLRGELEDLDLSATEAFMISMNTDDAPGRSRLGSYFARKQAYMKIRYPKMTFMVYFGATFLALHSIFDGICMALQPTIEQTWFVFGNLLIHRVLIAVITTMELMSSNFRSSQIAVVVFIISIMPSLGSVFGTLVARSAAEPQTLAQLLSVSAGSLLYVTFFELYRGDKREYIIGPFQCMSTFIGFLLSTFAYILATRSHRI